MEVLTLPTLQNTNMDCLQVSGQKLTSKHSWGNDARSDSVCSPVKLPGAYQHFFEGGVEQQ